MLQNILNLLRRPSVALIHDLVMIPIAFLGAYLLRYNFEQFPPEVLNSLVQLLPWGILIQALCFIRFGLYRGIWQFASMPDLMRIIKAVLLGTTLIVFCSFLFTRAEAVPRSVIVIYAMILIFLLGGSRFAFRWMKEFHQLDETEHARLLILGASIAAEAFIRNLKREGRLYHPIGILDDHAPIGQEIHGIRVLGRFTQLKQVIAQKNPDLVVFATHQTASQMRDLIQECQQAGKTVRMLPTTQDVMQGKINIELREIELEDLLCRAPVQLNWDLISLDIKDKTILVTGAGGSIGSELCRQLLLLNPKYLVITDRSECHLFSLEQELLAKTSACHIVPLLLDITDEIAVQHYFKKYSPSIVFHAAAYKHVPMLQSHVREAISNNIIGTLVVAQAAIAASVAKFILVSSDKAVHPTNIMGGTKRVAEMIAQGFNHQKATQFITVRFGNVLGSTGSVVPIFQSQLQKGGPLTVTHPEITRYFMTIPEASQLILQAAALGSGGEIFVLDMGEPIKISFLAEQMIRLAGKQPYDEIDIVFTGLRPGEKLREELFYSHEKLLPTPHQKIHLAEATYVAPELLFSAIQRLKTLASTYEEEELLMHLQYLTNLALSENETPFDVKTNVA